MASGEKKKKTESAKEPDPVEPVDPVLDAALDPGQGTDLSQAGEVLARKMREGKYDPSDSTPKPIGPKADKKDKGNAA